MTFLGLEARANLPKVRKLRNGPKWFKRFDLIFINVYLQVTYPTALDHFIFLSFGFIFATIVQVITGVAITGPNLIETLTLFLFVQFAFVHYFTKYGFGEVYFSDLITSPDSEPDDEQLDSSDDASPSASSSPSAAVGRKVFAK